MRSVLVAYTVLVVDLQLASRLRVLSVEHNLMVVLLGGGSRIEVLLRSVLLLALSLNVIFIHNVVEVGPLILSRSLVLIHRVVGTILVGSTCHGSRYQHRRVAMASALRLSTSG